MKGSQRTIYHSSVYDLQGFFELACVFSAPNFYEFFRIWSNGTGVLNIKVLIFPSKQMDGLSCLCTFFVQQ